MSTITLNLTAALQQQTSLATVASSTEHLLEEEIGLPSTRATWDYRTDSRNRPVLVLSVRDSDEGEVTRDFAPDELQPEYERHLRERLHDMKGALLIVGRWKSALNQLFSDIESWSKTINPRPFCSRDQITIREQMSGPYTTDRLRVAFGSNSILFTPIAAWIVGGQGRVDVDGPNGTAELILDENDHWKLNTFDRHKPYVPFDQKEFAQLMADISIN